VALTERCNSYTKVSYTSTYYSEQWSVWFWAFSWWCSSYWSSRCQELQNMQPKVSPSQHMHTQCYHWHLSLWSWKRADYLSHNTDAAARYAYDFLYVGMAQREHSYGRMIQQYSKVRMSLHSSLKINQAGSVCATSTHKLSTNDIVLTVIRDIDFMLFYCWFCGNCLLSPPSNTSRVPCCAVFTKAVHLIEW
jgi:hypothetical protein